MREIKHLGLQKYNNDKRKYRYSIFECESCNKKVIKKTKDGINAKYCSHKCYAEKRERRGAYKELVFISGYIYKYAPDHPNCSKNNYVAEHRLIAEKIIGRYLNDSEVVHHIDGNKTNNEEENLKVLTISEHNKLHKNKAKRDNYGKFKK